MSRNMFDKWTVTRIGVVPLLVGSVGTLELCDCGSSARKVKLSSFGTGNNKEGIRGEAQSSL